MHDIGDRTRVEKRPAAAAGHGTLDPPDWEAARAVGHRMVDDMFDFLRDVRSRPAWRRPPEDTRERLRGPLPVQGAGLEAAYEAFRRDVLPYPTGNIHPRFWGWVIGTGTPTGMLAEMLAAGLNPNTGGFDDAASLVEEQVIAWLREIMGFPASASGILVSGGSMANLVGLAVMRSARAGFDVRRYGMAAAPQPFAIYASRETHSSVRKAVEVLGLGRVALREIGVSADYRIDTGALAEAVRADGRAGLRPLCVVANAGTVNTGAVDDLQRVADLCAREGLWMHVDGAFGAMVRLDPSLHALVRGMERADSLAFDLHKWGAFPLEVGCTLVRDAEAHRAAFATEADYLATMESGIAARSHRQGERGIQLSRGFRALKVWMGLLEHGTARIGAAIRRNIDEAQALADRVRATPELALLAEVTLNVVCFRYVGHGASVVPEGERDALNRRIVLAMHESGFAVPSYTRLGGRFAIRVAVTNHRTTEDDLLALAAETVRLGAALREEDR